MPSASKAEHVREILDKLREVRAPGLDQAVADRVHLNQRRVLAREGRITAAYAIERYTPLRRRAILVATLLDLERRLTDAALGMADRLIGASFTRGNSARERTYTATSREVGRLMRLLHGSATAVEAALRDGGDMGAAIDGAVRLDRLARSAPQAAAIADLAEEYPLVRAADRWLVLWTSIFNASKISTIPPVIRNTSKISSSKWHEQMTSIFLLLYSSGCQMHGH